VADPDVVDAMRRSFLGRLPTEVVDALLADGERTDYPAGSTVYREGSAPKAALVVSKGGAGRLGPAPCLPDLS
jgi:CRP/FNR family transcriptional regulator